MDASPDIRGNDKIQTAVAAHALKPGTNQGEHYRGHKEGEDSGLSSRGPPRLPSRRAIDSFNNDCIPIKRPPEDPAHPHSDNLIRSALIRERRDSTWCAV